MPSPRHEIHALLTASSPAAALDRLRVWEAEYELDVLSDAPEWPRSVAEEKGAL